MADTVWFRASSPPTEVGWYLVALLPVNHEECGVEGSNRWRESFGCSKAFFNPNTQPKWWEPDAYYRTRSRPVDDRVTHWAPLPSVPLLGEIPVPRPSVRGWWGKDEEALPTDEYRRILHEDISPAPTPE